MLHLGSKATHFSAWFTFVDLDFAMSGGQLVVKKEKTSSSLPPKRTSIDLTIKPPGSQKRKLDETLDLEILGVEEELRKSISFL